MTLYPNSLSRRCRTGASAVVLAVATSLSVTAQGASILFIDDDRGQVGQSAWLSTLAALGHGVSYEAIASNGQPVSSLSGYDAVIWSVGDAAYSNLTSTNVSTLTSYLNGGGRLLYAGGHNVYEENFAQGFIQTYLGLGSYQYDMPSFGSCGSTASATGSLGSFTLNCMSTGSYNTMMSGFNAVLPTAADLLVLNTPNIMFHGGASGTAIAAINVADGYRAATWGFDLNHVASFDQAAVLSNTLDLLLEPAAGVPGPGTFGLTALALLGLVVGRRRQK